MTRQTCFHFYCPEYKHCPYMKQHKPCRHPIHQVQWFHDLVQITRARVYKKQQDNKIIRIVCPHCGRNWEGRQQDINHYAPGVIYGQHMPKCESRTPTERHKNNQSREWSWKYRPLTKYKAWNDPHHPGLAGANTTPYRRNKEPAQ